jgi:ATP-binding cassette subfamily B protein
VKYFNNEQHESRRYDLALQRYEKAGVISRTSLSLLNIGQAGIIAIGATIMMAMAARGVVSGIMTVGDFVLVNTYLIQLYTPLNFLGTVYREIRQALLDMEKMFNLLQVDVEVEDAPGAPPLRVERGAVAFENVEFGYDSRRPILKGVSFSVPPGKTVAIVGPSGAGKSTISRLLFRFYDVNGGRITIDGQDIRAVQQQTLRAAIGIVPQDTVLFNDTVYYNVAYGRPDATKEEVERAAKMARIHDFVLGLPDGYKAMVGERGLKLSGGEKQRVAIARALAGSPSVILADEPTAALDSENGKGVMALLSQVAKDKSRAIMVVTHDHRTLAYADRLIRIEDGRIVGRARARKGPRPEPSH